MLIKVWMDTSANIHSAKADIIDVEEDWGLEAEDWLAMSDEEKYNMVEEWAWNNGLDIGWQEYEG